MTMPDSAEPTVPTARPVVGTTGRSRAPWVFGGLMVIAAIGLFSALEARRATISSPAVTIPTGPVGGTFAAPPELVIPKGYDDYSYDEPLPEMQYDPFQEPENAMPVVRPAPPQMPRTEARAAEPRGTVTLIPRPAQPGTASQARPQRTPEALPDDDSERSQATRFANPSTTVPKGTVIHAVLETALDSNRAGFARAIVSRNVTSFDGTRLLIPKGSKLLGEYEADLNHGQNRALIQWHRLMLPGGVIIDVDSPSSDSLGRAGVRGKVNSHFFSRFGGAILQSALDIGTQLAAREAAGDTVIVGVPIGSQERISPQTDVKPTLTIRQGSSVAVFVARDLDFSNAPAMSTLTENVYLGSYLAPLAPYLSREDVTDIFVNRPGEIWVRSDRRPDRPFSGPGPDPGSSGPACPADCCHHRPGDKPRASAAGCHITRWVACPDHPAPGNARRNGHGDPQACCRGDDA